MTDQREAVIQATRELAPHIMMLAPPGLAADLIATLDAALDALDAKPIASQPTPVNTARSQPVTPAVMQLLDDINLNSLADDVAERDRVGRERYGQPLHTHDGRDAARDCYEELLDAVQYAVRCGLEAIDLGGPVGWGAIAVDVARIAECVRRLIEDDGVSGTYRLHRETPDCGTERPAAERVEPGEVGT